MTPLDRSSYGRGPFLIRNPRAYPTYPKSGQFRYHGHAKGYMYRWELFLRGRIEEVLPTFVEYIKDVRQASDDTRLAESRFSQRTTAIGRQ